ncbi:MFS transporter [Nocardia macrotermitis]|uniref:Putative sialic acid transporter n=1 Tax=Nocardia macrotermitis TaxID=2585198 RepID=A0A7K0CYX5_9NOCA|nr:MFS transporter [Nocardia macrotermitis]MQY18142.1 putative sialic acid transporter [Nocardia macrotermitis]
MPAQSTSAVPADATAQSPFTWRFLSPLYLASILNPVNTSLIATALVPIAHGLGIPIGQTAALVTALYLASAVAQPTAGKAAEVFGPRRVLIAGAFALGVGGLIGWIAPDLLTLLISRVLIGLGTSCAYPTAMLLIRKRAREAGMAQPPGGVLGGLQITGVATASLGLPIGGLLVGALGWRSVFFVNLPLALITLVATLIWVEADGPSARRGVREIASRLDLAGIAGFAVAMLALLIFLFELPTAHWWILIASIVLWAGVIGWELRAASPFLDVRLLAARPALTNTYVLFGLVMLCQYIVLYGLTQWVETVRGYGGSSAGLLLLPMTLISGVAIAVISRRNLIRGPVIAAAVISLTGSAGVLLLDAGAWIGLVAVITLLFGAATGFAVAGYQTALYTHAPAEQLGTAAGLLRTFGYIGSIASSAITGMVFHRQVTDHGLHLIAWIMVGISLVLTALTLADRSLRTAPAHTD